jgi:hypothetical protein
MKGDQLPSKMRAEGNFPAQFSRSKSRGFPKHYSSTKFSMDLLRVFLCYVNILIRIFDGNGPFPCLYGMYGGLYRQNLPYNFKKLCGDFQNRNFERSNRNTGPRSNLRPDSWLFANSSIETAFGIIEIDFFWSPGAFKQTDSTSKS